MDGSVLRINIFSQFLSLGTRSNPSLEARRRGGLVNGLCIVGIIFLVILGTFAGIRDVRTLALIDYSAALTLVLLLAFFWTTGRYNAASHAGVILIGMLFLYLLMSGGEDQTAYVWFFAYPLMATFLLSTRKGLIASISLLTLAIVYFFVGPLVNGWAEYPRAFEIRFIASFVVVTLFSFIYEKMRSDADEALAEQTETLQTTVNNLTETQSNLSTTNDRLRGEIQQRMEAVAEMQSATLEAHRANQAKSQFLANMSHELRTPMNHVIGFTEIVLSEKVGELNPAQLEYLGDVVSSGRHLLAIINDILDLSRVEAGKSELEYGEVDPRSLLHESLRIVEDQAEQKGIQLEVSSGNLPDSIIIDERMIRQVLYNLLQNAVKFTNNGDMVTLSGGMSEVSDETVYISVTDNGIGLDPKNLERVFDDFERIAGEHQVGQGGTGLGLALCQRFIGLHGGNLWAASEGLGTGSTFTFNIPIQPRTII